MDQYEERLPPATDSECSGSDCSNYGAGYGAHDQHNHAGFNQLYDEDQDMILTICCAARDLSLTLRNPGNGVITDETVNWIRTRFDDLVDVYLDIRERCGFDHGSDHNSGLFGTAKFTHFLVMVAIMKSFPGDVHAS